MTNAVGDGVVLYRFGLIPKTGKILHRLHAAAYNNISPMCYLHEAILYRRGISKIYNDGARRRPEAVRGIVVICRNLSATSDPEGNKDDFA